MVNLLEETIEVIKSNGLSVDDIVFIGSEKTGHSCTWDEYIKLADRNYDDGYGSHKVAANLIIVFANGARMLRGEYDGSEWWGVITPFVMPKLSHPIETLFVHDYREPF